MLKLKTRWFNKWAKKNSISDEILLNTIESLKKNLNIVNLGAGLCKIRTPQTGKGKSGGYRTVAVYKKSDKAIFVYGFSKAEKDNLSKEELRNFKILAKDLLQISKKEYLKQIELGNFFRLE